MKKTLAILSLFAALAAGFSARGEGLFNANELSLFGFGNYVDRQEDNWGGGVGVSYFLTRSLGIGASTHWENFDGAFIDNAAGELYFRLPLGSLPLAPYAIGSAGYSWENEGWLFGAGGGVEARFTENVGIFSDIQYLFNEGAKNDGVAVRIGIRLNM